VPSQRQAGIGRFDDMNRRTRLYRAHCEASPWDERPMVEPYLPVEASFAWQKWKKIERQESTMQQVLAKLKPQPIPQGLVPQIVEERLIPFEFSPGTGSSPWYLGK